MTNITDFSEVKASLRNDIQTVLGFLSSEENKIETKRAHLNSFKCPFRAHLQQSTKPVKTVNFGGQVLSINSKLFEKHSKELGFLSKVLNDEYSAILPKDKNGVLFFDMDTKWIQPLLNLMRDIAMWDGEDDTTKPTLHVAPCEEKGFVRVAQHFNITFGMDIREIDIKQQSKILGHSQVADGIHDEILGWLPPFESNGNKPTGFKSCLLYRGSEDGFLASDFHSKCDGIENTLTIVQDTVGCVFGGFADVPWESSPGGFIASSKSFLFSILRRNIYKPMHHSLSLDHKCALYSSKVGPTFGGGHDLRIADNCNQNKESYCNNHGHYYRNPDGYTSLSVERNFTVQEIEVFQIIEDNRATSERPNKRQRTIEAPQPHATSIAGRSEHPTGATLHADIDAFHDMLKAANEQIDCEISAYREELCFVAKYAGVVIPNSDSASGDVTADIAKIVNSLVASKPVECSSHIITINAGGTLITTTKDTLRQAPEGSPLANMASDAWGHDLDSDGNIYQDVNSELFLAIINHLRLKSLRKEGDPVDLPITVFKNQESAMKNLLAFYMISDVAVVTIRAE